jgi:hypothetical protein
VNTDIFYSNEDGSLLATSKNFQFNKLPESAIAYINKHYAAPKYEVKNCIEYTTAENDTRYYVSVESNKHTKILEVKKNGSVSFFKTI